MEKPSPYAAERSIRLVLIGGVAAPVMLAAVVLIVGQVTPGYDPVSETISQAGTFASRYGAIQNTSFTIYGLIMLAAAYGFYKKIGKGIAIFIAFNGFASITLGVFADSPDYPGKPFSQDILHNAAAATAYAALMLSVITFMRMVKTESAFRKLVYLGLVVLILGLPMPFVTIIEPLKPIAGLLQRLFMLSSLSWLVLASFTLYRYHSSLGIAKFLQEKMPPSDIQGVSLQGRLGLKKRAGKR